MPWATTRSGTHAKYRSAEHRNRRAALVRELKEGHVLWCSAKVCVLGDRILTNPDGNASDGLHLGHEDDGITYRGPEHRACNLHDAGVRARARQTVTPLHW